VKYIDWLKRSVTPHLSLGRLLSLHIWAGLLAALVAILHSGHKYESPIGIALVIVILIVVGTGFVGRYYLGHVGSEVRREQALLGTLRGAYDNIALRLGARQGTTPDMGGVRLMDLVDAIADTEYALKARETAKSIAARWTVVHIVAAIVLYGLLLLHVASGIYYGLRWLS
jgi:hypothetical protein